MIVVTIGKFKWDGGTLPYEVEEVYNTLFCSNYEEALKQGHKALELGLDYIMTGEICSCTKRTEKQSDGLEPDPYDKEWEEHLANPDKIAPPGHTGDYFND